MEDMEKMLRNYRLTTAEILYCLPDFPMLLQSYTWQELDQAPEFPVLRHFLNFWEHTLEGKLYSVKIASCELVRPAQLSFCKGQWKIH